MLCLSVKFFIRVRDLPKIVSTMEPYYFFPKQV